MDNTINAWTLVAVKRYLDFCDPLPDDVPMAVTSIWGFRQDPVAARIGGSGDHTSFHYGLDIATYKGIPIFAMADGTIIYAGKKGGYGNLVSIKHNFEGINVETRYGHMFKIVVHKGQKIKKGELIGFVGSTGKSTGDHLHLEVRVEGKPTDPSLWIDT